MKRIALLLALVLMLCSCAETPPPATTAPPLPTEPVETTAPVETTVPPETTAPTVSDPFAEYYALLEYTHPETNWFWCALGCTFADPSEIDLEYLFYSGFRLGSWDLLSPESEQALIDLGFWRELDIQPMPVDQIEQVLQETFGISLSDCTIPEGWIYVEKEDMFCSNHNDAYGITDFTITAVNEHTDGLVELHYLLPSYYDTRTGEFLDNMNMILSFRKQEDGSILILSNVRETTVITDFAPYEALISFSAQPNWLARSLGCLYESPSEIDMNYMFYLGVDHPGSWGDISEKSRQTLLEQGFIEEMDLQIMPAEILEEALMSTFGINLMYVEMPEEWGYIVSEDAFCSNHSDAFFPGVPTITAVEDDGKYITIHYTIDSYWITATGEFMDTAPLVLSLVRNEDGTIHAVSNLLES